MLTPMFATMLAAAAAAEPPTVSAGPGKGITVTSADDRFSMNVRARVLLRETVTVTGPDDTGERQTTALTQLKTARLVITGHVLSSKTAYVTQWAVAPADFREPTASPVYDAYFDFTQSPNASVRVGQMFVPFDRARTIREFALQLPERAKPVSELTLDRDIGAYVYSEHLGGPASPVAYRVGVFGGAGIAQTTAHPPGALAVARLELRPLGDVDDDSEGDLKRRDTPGLALGVGGAVNLDTTRQKSTTGATFTDGTTTYTHAAADLVFKWRGIYLLGEGVVRVAEDDAVEADDGTSTPTRSGWGWLAQGAYMFHEQADVAVRYAELRPLEGTDPAMKQSREVGAATAVYLNGHRFKAQLGWIATYEAEFSDAEHTMNLMLDTTF